VPTEGYIVDFISGKAAKADFGTPGRKRWHGKRPASFRPFIIIFHCQVALKYVRQTFA